jgi:anti-anti-sigma factor
MTPDRVALVEVTGEIDLASGHFLDHALEAAGLAGATAIVVDLRATTFMDVRGLRTILVAAEEAYVRGRPIELRGAPPGVNRMLDVLEMSWLFDRADADGRQQN